MEGRAQELLCTDNNCRCTTSDEMASFEVLDAPDSMPVSLNDIDYSLISDFCFVSNECGENVGTDNQFDRTNMLSGLSCPTTNMSRDIQNHVTNLQEENQISEETLKQKEMTLVSAHLQELTLSREEQQATEKESISAVEIEKNEPLEKIKELKHTSENGAENQVCSKETTQNPAFQILAFVQKSILFEKIPKAIDSFTEEFKKYKKNSQELDFGDVLKKVEETKHVITAKLSNLRNTKWYSPIFNVYHIMTSPFRNSNFEALRNQITFSENHPTVSRSNNSSQTCVKPTAEPINSSVIKTNNYVMNNGESSECVQLIRSLYASLTESIRSFHPIVKAADKLDNLVLSAFGLRLYSEKFRQLCFFWSISSAVLDESSTDYEGFREIVETFEKPSHKENAYAMSKDVEIMAAFKKLDAVLSAEFYKLCAIMQAAEIFGAFPAYCKDFEQKYCLEAVEDACKILIYVAENNVYNNIYSKNIREGIMLLQKQYDKMKLFC